MSKFLKNYGKVLVLTLGILAGALLLFDAFKLTMGGENSELVNGIDAIFGTKNEVVLGSSIDFKFNIQLLLALLIPIIAGIIAIVMKGKLAPLFTLLLFIAGIILLVSFKELTTVTKIFGSDPVEVKVKAGLAALGWVSVGLQGLGALTSIGLIIEEN